MAAGFRTANCPPSARQRRFDGAASARERARRQTRELVQELERQEMSGRRSRLNQPLSSLALLPGNRRAWRRACRTGPAAIGALVRLQVGLDAEEDIRTSAWSLRLKGEQQVWTETVGCRQDARRARCVCHLTATFSPLANTELALKQ